MSELVNDLVNDLLLNPLRARALDRGCLPGPHGGAFHLSTANLVCGCTRVTSNGACMELPASHVMTTLQAAHLLSICKELPEIA